MLLSVSHVFPLSMKRLSSDAVESLWPLACFHNGLTPSNLNSFHWHGPAPLLQTAARTGFHGWLWGNRVVHWKGYYGRLTAATVSAETPSRLLKASRWAGNVGELAKQRSPISSPLFAAFTLLPYYRVYRSAFTPLGHHPPSPSRAPLSPPRARSGQARVASEREESGEKQKQTVREEERCGEPIAADPGCSCLPACLQRQWAVRGWLHVSGLRLQWSRNTCVKWSE